MGTGLLGWDAVTRSPASGRWRTIPQAGQSPLFRIPSPSPLSPATWYVLVREGCLRSGGEGVCGSLGCSLFSGLPPYSQVSTVGRACLVLSKEWDYPECFLLLGARLWVTFFCWTRDYKMSCHCVVSQVSLLSVFSFLFSEFYGYLFKFQSVVSFSRHQYKKKMSVCHCLAQDSFLILCYSYFSLDCLTCHNLYQISAVVKWYNSSIALLIRTFVYEIWVLFYHSSHQLYKILFCKISNLTMQWLCTHTGFKNDQERFRAE